VVPLRVVGAILSIVVALDLTLGSRRHFVGRSFVERNPVERGGAYMEPDELAMRRVAAAIPPDERIHRMEAMPNESLVLGYRGTTAFVSFHEAGFLRFLESAAVGPPFDFNPAVRGAFLDRPEVLGALGVSTVVRASDGPDPFLRDTHRVGPVFVSRLRAARSIVSFFDRCVRPSSSRRLDGFDRAMLLRQAVSLEGDCPVTMLVPPASPEWAYAVVGPGESSVRLRRSPGPRDLELVPLGSPATIRIPLDPPLVARDTELSFELDASGYGQIRLSFVDATGAIRPLPDQRVIFGEPTPIRIVATNVSATALEVALETTGASVWLRNFHVFHARNDREALAHALESAPVVEPHMRLRWVSGSHLRIVVSQLRTPLVARIAVPFSTGWTARVDGVPRPLLAVDGGLLGVALRPGDRVIELGFRPVGAAAGLGVTLAALGVCLGLAARAYLRARALRSATKEA
jgi:hypothetical protein